MRVTVVSYPIYDAASKLVKWSNATEFNSGTFNDTYVRGADDAATIEAVPILTTLFFNDFKTLDAAFAAGSVTATPVGGASVSGGELLLNNDDLRYVDYSATSNIGVQTGAVRVKFIPNYSGSPAISQRILDNVEALSMNENRIRFSHTSGGNLNVGYFDSAGVSIVDTSVAFVAVGGQEYELEINWDFDTGFDNLIVDGIELFNNAVTGTRTNTSTLIRVGTTATTVPTQPSNFRLGSYQIFDAVQHSGNYSAPAPSYVMSGTFESNVFDSTIYQLDWNIVNINKLNSPSGVVNLSVRASDSSTPTGPYFPLSGSLDDGEVLTIKGQYIQWLATYSDSGQNTSVLDDIGFYFNVPQTEIVSGG